MIYKYSDIKNFYENFYLFNIKQLCNIGFYYDWRKIEDVLCCEQKKINNGQNFEIYSQRDYFLNYYKKNKINLGKDIIKNGTFWPLFLCDNYLMEGFHRVYSLKLLKDITEFDKKFLCLNIPYDLNIYLSNKNLLDLEDLENPINYYKVDLSGSVILDKTKNSYIIFMETLKFSGDFLNNRIFQINKEYPNYIKPNPVFNNEKLFEQFLKDESF
jgi:hypothetical protein